MNWAARSKTGRIEPDGSKQIGVSFSGADSEKIEDDQRPDQSLLLKEAGEQSCDLKCVLIEFLWESRTLA